MNWIELSVDVPSEFVEPLSQMFYRYGQGGIALEEESTFKPNSRKGRNKLQAVTLKTYLPIDSTTQDRLSRLDIAVKLLRHVCSVSELQSRVINENEWQTAWKEHFHVLRVGKRIVICPSWQRHTPKKSDIVITLDPGMAFGTGHHPTTQMCLQQLENLITSKTKVLDVGCGSGILSIAAAKLGAEAVFGIEIDSTAHKVATQNVEENGVSHIVKTAIGTLPNNRIQPKSYDIVIANITASVLIEIAPNLIKAMRPDGKVIASGILAERKQSVEKKLVSSGVNIDHYVIDGDWVTLIASACSY